MAIFGPGVKERMWFSGGRSFGSRPLVYDSPTDDRVVDPGGENFFGRDRNDLGISDDEVGGGFVDSRRLVTSARGDDRCCDQNERWKGRIRCGPYRSDGESSDVIRRVTEVRGAALLKMTIKERSAVIL